MDQETAIEMLRERYARGGVPLEEFRRMMSHLMVTTDPIECQAILDELPPEPPQERAVALRHAVSSSSTGQKAHRISAFFGEVDRGGVLWELGPETHVSATFGEANIDVRMAKLVDGENILRLSALFGEISVIVPKGCRWSSRGRPVSARFRYPDIPSPVSPPAMNSTWATSPPAVTCGSRLWPLLARSRFAPPETLPAPEERKPAPGGVVTLTSDSCCRYASLVSVMLLMSCASGLDETSHFR